MKRRNWKRACSVLVALCLMGSGFWESGFYSKAQGGQESAGEAVTGNVQETPDSVGGDLGTGAVISEEEPGTGAVTPGENEPGTGSVAPGEEPGTGNTTPGEEPGTGVVTPGENESGTGNTTPGEESGTGVVTPEENESGTGNETPGEEPGTGVVTPGENESGNETPGEEPGTGTVSDGDTSDQQDTEARQTDILFQDFEGTAEGALPQGWTFGNPGNSKAGAGVKIIDGNHVLVLDQSEDNSNANYNPGISYVLPQSYKKVVFSYSIAAKSSGGVLYLPSVTGTVGGSTKRLAELSFNTSSGDFIKYQTVNDNNWHTIQPYETMRWYTVKIVYDNTGAESAYSVFIDGNPVALEHPSPRAQGDVSGFSTTLYRKNTGVFYLDNVRMTVEDHEPVKPGDLEPEEPVQTSVAYSQDFENVEIGKLPAGWAGSNLEATTNISVQEKEGQRVLVLAHPTVQGTSLTLRYPFAAGASVSRAVLKYRVKAEESSGAFYLPSFYSNSAQLVKLALNGGKLQKGSEDGKSWIDITSCDAGTWYEIELMLDTAAGVYDLYLDGKLVVSQEKLYATGEINRMAMGIYKVTSNTFYLDDLEILDYVEGTGAAFAESSYEVVKGRNLQLGLSFEPADTSCRSAVYTSSDESIAMVDNLGIVTGLTEGTVTITATPSLKSLPPVSTQVTVTNVLPERIEVTPETVTIPAGGHLFVNAKVLPEDTGNPKVIFSSDNRGVATVDEWGEIVAAGEGSTVIRVVSEERPEIFAEIPVTVTARNVMKQIYVSPRGDDGGDGSASGPVKTLERAKELVRQNNQNMTGDIEVILADGYYLQTETLALDEQDGGREQHYVVYRHEGQGEAVIGGRRVITGFSLYDKEKGIYVADAPGLETRQLYVDGVRAVRARSEAGLNSPVALMEGGVNRGYTCANPEILEYRHPEDLELIFQEQWTNPRCGVASVEESSGRTALIMDQPGWNYVSDKGGTSASVPVYYENALELLDEPGEWYLDIHEGKVYYMPRPWEDMSRAEVSAPVLEELVRIQGTDYDHMVENIEFVGITFADTTWNRPSTSYGHADAQNNHIREHGLPDRLPDAAVTVKRANSVRFFGCSFTRMGITALKMVEGVQNSPIRGNRFYDISGSAVNIGDPYTNNPDNYNPEDIRKLMKNCDVENNYIHDIGVDYQSAAAVSVGFAADMDLSYNEIFNIPYSAFHIGYGWAKRFENVQRNMVIEHNFIHDLMGDGIYDGGAVYFNGNSGGSDENYNRVTENYIRNQMDLNAPLYADEGTTYWHWERNVVDLSESPLWHNNASPRWMLVYVPTIEHLKVNDIYTTTDNKHVNPEAPWVEISDIHVHPDAVWPEDAVRIIEESGLQEAYAGLRNSQAERIRTNAGQGNISIPVGGTFAVEVSGTDGRDRPVSMADALTGYRVVNPEIAEVSARGVVKGLKSGTTDLEIYVVSNGILDVIEAKLYVGDVFSKISLKGVENDTILLGETSKGFQAQPSGLTDMGRQVELANITYQLADTSIASVTADGYITPVKAGNTVLTVTAEGEGRIVEQEFTLQIEEKQEFREDNVWEIFDTENADEWVVEGGSLEKTGEGQITTTLTKFATFTGCKFRNELMTFRMKIDANGKGGWPSIVLRAQSADKAVSGGATGYIICFGASGLELHRFIGSRRTVIYGSMDGYTSLGGPVIQPEPLTHGEEHEVQVGALTNGDTVRLFLSVDGVTVFDFTDEEADAITEPGYFGLVGRGETFTLTKDTSIPDDKEPEESPSPSPKPEESPSPSPSPKPEESPSPSPKPEESPSPSPKPEESPSPSPKPEDSPSPSPKPEDSPSPSPKPEESPSPSPKPEDSPSPSPKPEESPSPSPKPEDSPSPSPSPKPEESPSPSPKPEDSPSPSPKPEDSPSPSPKPEESPSPSLKPEESPKPEERPDSEESPKPEERPDSQESPKPEKNPNPEDSAGLATGRRPSQTKGSTSQGTASSKTEGNKDSASKESSEENSSAEGNEEAKTSPEPEPDESREETQEDIEVTDSEALKTQNESEGQEPESADGSAEGERKGTGGVAAGVAAVILLTGLGGAYGYRKWKNRPDAD